MQARLSSVRLWFAGLDQVERFALKTGCAVLGVSAIHAARGFWFLIPIDPLSALIYLAVALLALGGFGGAFFHALRCGRRQPSRLMRRLACSFWIPLCAAVFPLADPYFQGARLRYWVQGGADAYLRFAVEARSKFPDDLPAPPEDADAGWFLERRRLEEQRRREFRTSLDQRLLNHRPTTWLYVGVDKRSISLWSGSGLTGSWGIEICDQPELPRIHTEAEIRENPYLPRYRPFSERVWFWTSD